LATDAEEPVRRVGSEERRRHGGRCVRASFFIGLWASTLRRHFASLSSVLEGGKLEPNLGELQLSVGLSTRFALVKTALNANQI
jgi:hypothetical protein